MSRRSFLHTISAGDFTEVERVLRICLGGMPLPAALSFRAGEFAFAGLKGFLAVHAAHAMQVRELAARRETALIVKLDAALDLPPASGRAGRDLLSQREGARHLTATRRFTASVAAGQAPGHFATVFALQAAEFSVAVLPMLQCLLYCEWHAAQLPRTSRTLVDFFRSASSSLAALPALTKPCVNESGPVLAAIR